MFGDVAFAQAPFASQGGNTFNAAISEAGSINSVTVNTYIGVATNAEAVSASAVQSVIAAFAGSVSESTSGGAVFDTLNNTFNVAFSDAASGSSTVAAQVDFLAAMQEAASASSSITTSAEFVATVAELASASAALQGGVTFQVAVSEAASTSSAFVGNVIFVGTVEEFAFAIDNLGVIKTLNVTPTGVQLLVSVGNVLIWTTINDNQDPNWQNINDTQSTGWVVIQNPSTPGWNVVPS